MSSPHYEYTIYLYYNLQWRYVSIFIIVSFIIAECKTDTQCTGPLLPYCFDNGFCVGNKHILTD